MQGFNEEKNSISIEEAKQLLQFFEQEVLLLWKVEPISHPRNLVRFTSPDETKIVSYWLPLSWWKTTHIDFTHLGKHRGEIALTLSPWEGRERNKRMAEIRAAINEEISRNKNEKLTRQVQKFINP